MSRGNHRADIFAQEAIKATFLQCLEKAGTKAGWVCRRGA
jgi:hypothetical protein